MPQTQNKNKGDNQRIWIVFSHNMFIVFLVFRVLLIFIESNYFSNYKKIRRISQKIAELILLKLLEIR